MSRVGEVAWVFFRLAVTAFGGPAAHIAMMEDEVVRRRGWVSHERFLELLGAANLIPGPNSTEMAIHLGLARAGPVGLVVAGVCFIVPATLITAALAWAYVRYGQLPAGEWILYGVKPVVVAVVAQALWGLGRSSMRTLPLAAIAVGATVAVALGAHELVVLLCAGVAAAAFVRKGGAIVPLVVPLAAPAVAAAAAPTLAGIFGFFLKVGSVLYGSGYVLLAFLRTDLVDRWHWLSEGQLLDAVAAGQITPGPLFSTATFVGYLLGGGAGAAVATAGIFLPAFVFVAASGPLLPRIRKSPAARAFLDGVIAASLALMAVVAFQLGRAALVDGWTVGLAIASGVLLIAFRVGSAWLVLGGAAAGWLIHLV